MARVLIVILLGALLAVGIGVSVVRWQSDDAPVETTAATMPQEASVEATRRIRVNLFYVDAGGMDLVPVEREVPYAKAIAEQARLILEEQLKGPPEPLGAIVPEGVTIRGFYLTEAGDAFADFSSELALADVGGSLDEMLTVYALVNAVTINVPLVKTVQIMVNGREVDTLAGHIDLRHPLRKNTMLVKGARAADATAAGANDPTRMPPDPSSTRDPNGIASDGEESVNGLHAGGGGATAPPAVSQPGALAIPPSSPATPARSPSSTARE